MNYALVSEFFFSLVYLTIPVKVSMYKKRFKCMQARMSLTFQILLNCLTYTRLLNHSLNYRVKQWKKKKKILRNQVSITKVKKLTVVDISHVSIAHLTRILCTLIW